MKNFAELLEAWGLVHGRKGMPWMVKDPYAVWVSEIMLQQTTVVQATSYYLRWMEKFPTVEILAASSEDEVLAQWSGLGYYSRARNLLAGAKKIVENGGFPKSAMEMADLIPGVGRSTAGAICSFCFGTRTPILDGNVKRVLVRHFGKSDLKGSSEDKRLWALATDLMSEASNPSLYSQSIMDLGATVCMPREAKCGLCPFHQTCSTKGVELKEENEKQKKIKLSIMCDWILDVDDEGLVLMTKKPFIGNVWKNLWRFPTFEDLELNSSSEVFYEGKAVLSHMTIKFKISKASKSHSPRTAAIWGRFSLKELSEMGVPKPVKEIVLHLLKNGLV